MVGLKYIDNPFDEKMVNSISCFCEEKSFYDCVNRRFLNDQAFQHLEHSFYTYFLTGDGDEWIGYVLLSNENRVNSYCSFACEKILNLINDFRNKFGDSVNENELERLERLINENSSNSNINAILEEVIFSLKRLSVLNFFDSFKFKLDDQKNKKEFEILEKLIANNIYSNDMVIVLEEMFSLIKLDIPYFELLDNMFLNYHNQLQDYLCKFPDYFYLDVVIALPDGEKINIKKENGDSKLDVNLLAESKYYRFIQEAFAKVEEEIELNFKDVPILLRKDNKNVFLVNPQSITSNDEIVKKLKVAV